MSAVISKGHQNVVENGRKNAKKEHEKGKESDIIGEIHFNQNV